MPSTLSPAQGTFAIPVFAPEHLKKARVAAGLTQAETARRIGRALTTYQQYEQGDARPSVLTVGTLAGALGVRVGDLFHDPR